MEHATIARCRTWAEPLCPGTPEKRCGYILPIPRPFFPGQDGPVEVLCTNCGWRGLASGDLAWHVENAVRDALIKFGFPVPPTNG